MKYFDKRFLDKLSSVDADEAAYDAAARKNAEKNAEKKADAKLRGLANDEFKKEYNSAWTIENIYDEIGKLQDYYSLWKEYKAVDQLKETYNYAINLKKFLTDEGPDEKFPVEETTAYLMSQKAEFKGSAEHFTPKIMKLIDNFILNFILEKGHEILLDYYPKFLKDAMSALFSDNEKINKKIMSLIGGYRKRSNTKRRRQKRRKTTRR